MFAPLLLASTLVPADPPGTLYGPAVASFEVQFPGNPFDPAENDLRVRFVAPNGTSIERIAYWDGAEGVYKAVLVAPQRGTYRPVLLRNGKETLATPTDPTVRLEQPIERGYVRPSALDRNRFAFDDGTVYYPLGINLGWQGGPEMPKMPEQIEKMAKAGMNWTRIWACHWDGKNPWWPQDDRGIPGQLWTPALNKWDALFKAAETHRVPFQMVLFHHGAFSSRVNPNWPEHPWNAKNGGFLADAANFFTDAEAKRRAKIWLRYAVARWAHSPGLLSWELFNEVEWVDARYADRWADIAAWHTEMADYIRSIDPYKRMITTSSAMEQSAMWAKMDYYQPHTYPTDIYGAIFGEKIPGDKPLFFGEFGPGGQAPDNRQVVRDGIFASLFANHAGAAQYWYWDVVEKENLYDEFTKAAKAIELSGIATRPHARSLNLRVTSSQLADLTLRAPLGWAPSTATRFNLEPGTAPVLAGLSSYLQGTANAAMQPGPIEFVVNAPTAGTFTLQLAERSKAGGAIEILVDGQVLASRTYAARESESPLRDSLKVPYAAGRRTIVVRNPGADWIRIGSFSFTGLGPAAIAHGIGDSERSTIRLRASTPGTRPTLGLGGLPFEDGKRRVKVLRLDDGTVSEVELDIRGKALSGWTMPADDVVLVF